MSFRPPRNLPVISIFHNAASPPSQRALALLKKAVSEPYPSSSKSPLPIELSVVERTPTSDQFRTMQRYYGRPISAFLSAHPSVSSSENSSETDEAERVRDTVRQNPMALKYPIVVDWDAGKIAVGDISEVERILNERVNSNDNPDGGEGGRKEGFLAGLFGSS
ncbi:hypothetical protein FRC17_004570 [Serendipita sp. 399]|nr:hypothetical protein FRC17_004570 [Serendipita sp. 399]